MRLAFLLVTTAYVVTSSVVMAQVQTTAGPAPSEAVSSAAAPDQTGLGEIIVTAQRQSENSQRAAVPLDVIQGSTLLASGVTQVDSLNAIAPALSIQPTNSGNVIFVRGVGNFTLAPNSDPAIAFNYDGVYVGRPTSTTGVFYDIDRVEILKGPQGTLYGRNATGGAINVLPAQPKLGELSGYASIAYGNYKDFNGEGAINMPVGEHGAVRLSLSRSSHDGYLSDGTSDEDTWAGRAQMKAELTPDLTVRVAADFAHNGGKGFGIDYVGYEPSLTAFTPSNLPFGTGSNSAAGQAFRTGVTYAPLGNHLPAVPTPYQDNMFYGVNAEIAYKTDVGTLTIIPAWRDAKLNYLTNAGGIPYRDREEDNQYSLEARFAGTRIGPVDYQVGAYYYDEYVHTRTELTIGYLGQYQQPTYKTKSYAGFGRLTLHLADRLRVVGGFRYTQDDKLYNTTQVTSILSCLLVFAGQAHCPGAPTVPLFTNSSQLGYPFPAVGAVAFFPVLSINGNSVYTNVPLHNHKPTYRGAVEFDVGPRSLLYGSVESGYRSGGFSAAAGFETYQPETITAFTVGMKNRFLGNRLQANVEGFIWNYRNQQVSHIGPDASGKSANYTQNIGSAKIQGVEFDGKFLVTPTTLVSADIQYLDARQRNFVYLQGAGPTPATAAPVVGCPVTNVSATLYQVNCSGFPSYNSPKWTMSFSGAQTIKFDPFQVVLSADTQHRTSRYIGFQYLPQQLIGPSWTTNAQIQFGPSNERWAIAGYIRNLEDHRVPIYSILGGSNFLVDGTTAPRTYGVRISAKY